MQSAIFEIDYPQTSIRMFIIGWEGNEEAAAEKARSIGGGYDPCEILKIEERGTTEAFHPYGKTKVAVITVRVEDGDLIKCGCIKAKAKTADLSEDIGDVWLVRAMERVKK